MLAFFVDELGLPKMQLQFQIEVDWTYLVYRK